MPIVSLIERLGAFVIDGVSSMGDFIIFLAAALFYALQPPYKVRLLIRQMRSIGAESFFLVGLIGLFTGMVLGLQGYNTLSRFGSEGALGTVVALVLVRELGPVLAALMVAARAGSAMAAELGSMQATEQIDALSVMAINPVQYLVTPRVLAGIISFPLLTALFDVIGIWGGWAVGVGLMGAPNGPFFNGIAQNMSGHDIATGIYKALVFGLVVMWVCCYKGYHAERMATGVSRATTEAVVLSSVLILVWDYFLTSVLL
ncbi:MAG: phospholipid/cholesterol/gamma-HCH transport system permease protein [Candidatus Binataceae bacterium]|jgi:phospholipid/cholesterol/gamma-HCH transport system permease protein|nr:phospholipid/cholesterol/gamma-HCH transport system permease protein [Candidatus Binataceae bacterium]